MSSWSAVQLSRAWRVLGCLAGLAGLLGGLPGCCATGSSPEAMARTCESARISIPRVAVDGTEVVAGYCGRVRDDPAQAQLQVLDRAGLLSGRFAPVNLLTYESTLKPGIHVIGDACISGMPKAGHIGNQEAKTCASAIVNALKGSLYALEETAPVLNSACYTPLTSTRATWLSAVCQYANGAMVPSTENGVTQPRAATSATTGNYEDMEKWFATLMGDTFA